MELVIENNRANCPQTRDRRHRHSPLQLLRHVGTPAGRSERGIPCWINDFQLGRPAAVTAILDIHMHLYPPCGVGWGVEKKYIALLRFKSEGGSERARALEHDSGFTVRVMILHSTSAMPAHGPD